MHVWDVTDVLDKDIINNRLNELQIITEAFITKKGCTSRDITKDTLKYLSVNTIDR